VVSPPPAPHLWHPLTVSPELRAQPQVHDRRAGEGQPRRRNPGTRAQPRKLSRFYFNRSSYAPAAAPGRPPTAPPLLPFNLDNIPGYCSARPGVLVGR
jgi:hypothetical protein